MGTVAAEQPHPALRQLASPTRGQRMLCESQPPVSCAGAKAHGLSARALLLAALGTVARNCTHRLVSHLSRSGYSCTLRNCTHRLVSHLICLPLALIVFCSHSSPAVRRDAEATAQPRPLDPSLSHQPTSTVQPSRLRRHPTSSLFSLPALPLTPPVRIRCSQASPAP